MWRRLRGTFSARASGSERALLKSWEHGAAAEKVVGDPGSDPVGVFAEDGRHGSPCGIAQSLVIAGRDAVDHFRMIHDVGFEEDHRAFVHSGGEKVAEPKVRFVGNLAGGFAAVAEGGQARGGGHASGHG